MKSKHRYYLIGILITVILLIISQYLLYSKGFYSLSADEAGHTLEAYNWYNGNHSLFSIWLPFQKILYGTAFSVYYNLFWMPRLLSSFFGLLTLISIIFLTYELFHNHIVSLLSGFLASFFSCLVIFSVIPMTEIYFFFFSISSLAFFFRWRNTKRFGALLISILLCGIGTTTRYEAWTFSLLIFLAIIKEFYSGNEISLLKHLKLFCLFLVLFAFPIYWIYLSYRSTGEITSFLNSVAQRYSKGGTITEIKNNVFFVFFKINILSLNILGLITLIFYAKKDKGIKIYSLIFASSLIIMSFVTFISKAMPTHHFWRIASIWSIMLLPFTAQWLFLLLYDEKSFHKYSFIAFTFLFLFFFNMQTRGYTRNSFMTTEELNMGNYIHCYLKFKDENSKIYIKQNGYKYTSVLIASQEPSRFVTKGYKNIITNLSQAKDKKKILRKLGNIEYVILNSETHIKDLKPLEQFGNRIIYKLY